jgi:hypothetical protein
MLGIPAQQLQRMGQQINYGLERIGRTAGAARQIQNQHFSPHAADSAAERSQWSFF